MDSPYREQSGQWLWKIKQYPAEELTRHKVRVIFSNIKGCAEVGNNEFVIVPNRKGGGFSPADQGELSLLAGRDATVSKTCSLLIGVRFLTLAPWDVCKRVVTPRVKVLPLRVWLSHTKMHLKLFGFLYVLASITLIQFCVIHCNSIQFKTLAEHL